MNKEQLLFLYQNYANDKGFESFDEFASLMSNKESREVFFNESNKDLGFSDFNEFESTLGIAEDIKKKEESDSFAQEQAVESPTSSVPTITSSEEELQKEQPAGVFIDKSQDDKPTVSREFEVDASSLEGKKQKSSKNLSQLAAYNIPNLSDEEYSKLKNKTFQLPEIPKSKREADALYDLPVDEYGNKYDFTKRFVPEEQPNGEVEFVDTRDEDLAQAIDNYDKSKRNLSTTVKEGHIVSRDYLDKELDFNPSIDDQEVIRVTNSDPKDYLSWKEENVRKESGAYKFFKNLLTNEEGENFEKEQRQYLRASSYKASTLNKVQEDIETIDARINLTTNDEEILKLENEKERLKSSYKKEMKDLGSLIEKFPKFKEKTRDLDKERRSKIYNNSLEGNSFGDVSMNALSSSSEAIVDMSVGLLSSIPSIVDQIATASGFEEKGVFAGMTEMLLDTSEHYSTEYGAAKRSFVIQGKSVDYEDREYIVSDDGQIYDAETNILVTDLMGEEKVSDILDISKDSNIYEDNFDIGAGVENLAGTLSNLFGLIKGAGTLRSVSRNVLPKAINKKISKEAAGRISMGATSYATSSASTVQELKNDLMDKGLTEKEATEKAFFFGNAIASLDGVFSGLAGSNEKLLSGISGIKKSLIDLAKKDGSKFTKSKLKEKAKSLVGENLKEAGIEELPVLFSEKTINDVMNKSLGMTIRSGEVTSAEILETLFLTLGATTSLGTRGLLKNNTRSSMLDLLSQKDVNYDKYKDELVNQGSITNEEADSVIKEIKEYTEANSIINNTIKVSSNKRKAARLIKKQRKLKERLKNTEPSLSEDLENQIEEIDNSINELKEKDKRDLSRIKKGDDLETTPEEDPFASEEDGGLKLKEQASKRLLDRKKESGEEEFTVTDEEITEEALKIQEENRSKEQKPVNIIYAKRDIGDGETAILKIQDGQKTVVEESQVPEGTNIIEESEADAQLETTQEQQASEETAQEDLEAREQEIESRRREELEPVEQAIAISNETGETPTVNDEVVSVDDINEINAKYDAELEALNRTQSEATASTIAQETEGLTATQTFKQGLSEFVSSLREKESGKRKKLEQSYKEKLKNAKDKLKQKIKDSKDDIEAKNFLSTFIKDISSTAQKDKTIKLDEISSAALRKIQSKVKKADRSNLDQVTEEVFDIFDSQVRKKRNSNVQKKQIRARKKVKSGKAGMNQSSYLGSLRINPKFIPNTEKGNELLTRLENLLDSLTAKNIKIQDETGFNLQKEAVELSNMYQEMLDESSNLFEKLKKYQEQNNNPTKKEAILSMFSQGVINMNEARVLEGYNPPKKVDTKKKEGVTEEEQQERNELIGSILANKPDQRETFNKNKFFRDIVDDINSFTQEDLESTSTENLRALNNALLYALPANELTNIGKVITSVKSSKIVRDVRSLLGSNPARASVLNLAAQIGGLANRSIKNWGARSKALSAPLENIDFEVFKNYSLKDKKVYKNLFEPLAKAFSSRTDFVNRAFFLMDSALEKIRKEGNNKDFNKSSVKLAVLGLNQEYLSNPDNNKVFNPVDVINETLKSLVGKDSGYLDSYKEALQSFLNDFATMQDGNVVSIDYDAINESLTEGENDYLNNWNSEISPDLEQMGAIVTSAVRGESWSPLISYMPRVTMAKQTAKGIESIAESALTGDGGLTSNAKASVNKERVASTAPPMILDIFKSHRRAITEQSTDYHMTLALKNIASAIEKLKTEFSNEKNETGAKNVDLLERVLKRAVENDLVKVSASNNDLEVGWLADAMNHFRKKGYQFGLGYATRAAAELGSNFSFSSVAYPTETKNGLKYVRINEEDFINLAEMIGLVKSAQSSRLLGQELTSLMVEQGAIGTDNIAAIGKYGSAISSLSKKTGQTIDSIQRALLGRPDLITSRVTWIGTFATEYKKITGKSFNLNSFSSKVYFDNKEAFDEATKIADEKLSESVSTNNPYAGIVGSSIRPTGGSEIFKVFDKYLTRFPRQEKSTFKKGAIIAIKGEKGSGKNRKEGFRLMGASMSRMIMYNQLQRLGIGGLIALAEMLLGYGDDDEEDFGIIQKTIRVAQGHKDSEKYLYDINNEALSALLMIGTGGYGNVSKLAFNFGLETTNMYYGEGLTRPEGEDYDSFNNGLTYSFVNPEVLQGRPFLAEDLSFLASSNGAAVKNLIEVVQNSNSALNSKSKKTRDKAKEKLLYANLPTLIGTTTGIPTKDILNVSNHYLYAPKERAEYTEGLDIMSKEFRKKIEEIRKNMRD